MFSFSEMSYALVAGYDSDDPKCSQKTEVLHVNGSTKICNSTSNYPENVSHLSGGSFLQNNLIVTCAGGVTGSASYSMSNDLKWTQWMNFTAPQSDTAAVIVNNGLWVTGNGHK